MTTKEIDWSKQPCGVKQASIRHVLHLMPDVFHLIAESFPDNTNHFSWDVKVHMLMPRQYPCIPHWHVDNVPRDGYIQRFDKVDLSTPMYLWISGAPLTQFRHGYIMPKRWHRFTQADEHRGTPAAEFGWRGFIRATHKDILPPNSGPTEDSIRRHTQVYLDQDTYQW